MLRTSKSAYVEMVRRLARHTAGDQIPPERSQRLRHWAASLPRVHDSLAIAELDVPWWTYRSIDIVEAWLAAREEPVSVFEYGSGASTLWLARRCAQVTSVEHHAGFAEMMRGVLTQQHVSLNTIEPTKSAQPRIRSNKEGQDGMDFYDYVKSINDGDSPYDVIVIDGRAREACLRESLPHIKEDGIIIFDNSWRRRYRSAITSVPLVEQRFRGLTPTLPYPEQTSIISPRPINETV